MRSRARLLSILLGFVLFQAAILFVVCNGSAADAPDGAGDATVEKKSLPTGAATPVRTASFDLDQLPVGKTIGVVPGDARILKALDEPAEFSLTDAQLGDFVKQVAAKHYISVQLDVAALTADGKGTESVLNKTTKGTTLRSALRLFLDEQGLAFLIRDETLIITTKTAAETKTSNRIYQVHDLVYSPNDPYLRGDFESLMELISSTIQPESWREAGGTIGGIKSFRGPGIAVLVVQQTEDGHEQVEKLLADLRTAKVPALLELQTKRLIQPPQPGLGGTGPSAGSPTQVGGQGSGMGAGF